MTRPSIRRALLGGGAVVFPLGIVAIYLWVSRQDTGFTEIGDYVALLIAGSVGAGCLWHALPGSDSRPVAMVIYSLACLVALVMFSLRFVCAVFGDCL